MKLRSVALAGLMAALMVPAGTSAQVGGLPATVQDYGAATSQELSYPVAGSRGEARGQATWRVVAGTGNCCENYLSSSARGRLFDFGGSYLRYSDDLGLSWKEVRSVTRLVNGEGAVSGAPGGDIVGATWDPYSGDHLLSFKYDAKTETWLHQELFLHTPFFDRPWFAVIPGPFTVGTIETPYITVLKGGWPSKDLAYYSLDGLNYFLPTEKDSREILGPVEKRWLDVKPSAALDWMQPNTATGITPLGSLGALWTESDTISFATENPNMALMEPPDAEWSPFAFPRGGRDNGRYLVDSLGRLHHAAPVYKDGIARSFVYEISSDGGRTWHTRKIELPDRHIVEDWDFKANAKFGVTAIAVHAHRNEKKESEEADQDLVYELDIDRDTPRISNVFYVGNGDANVGAGLGSNLRFDFASVTILPGGQIATSFVDKMHTTPAMAILLAR
ncbi:MAG: hypothetical protein ACRDI3_05725 [Actinomycetota bacterium]